MVVVIIGMLVCIALALVVVALVALPAHRDGEVMFVNRRDAADDRQEHDDEAAAAPAADAAATGAHATTAR